MDCNQSCQPHCSNSAFKPCISVSNNLKPSNEPTRKETIVIAIVGAGVIGLCTAYHLAKTLCRGNVNPKYRIIIVDAGAKVFSATSATNTGILSYQEVKEELRSLARYSYDLLESLAKNDAQFQKDCGYQQGRNFAIRSGSGKEQDLVPHWLRMKP